MNVVVPITITNPRTKEREQVSGDLGHCRACPAEIVWIRNVNNRMQPYDREPQADGTNFPHHATCPAREQFRKRKAAQP